MSKPDDSDLERYLAGEHPVSADYRNTPEPEPPAELDTAIRQQAHSAAPKRRGLWLSTIAAAAVLVLGVGLVFELQNQAEIQSPAAVKTNIRVQQPTTTGKLSKRHRQPALKTQAVQVTRSAAPAIQSFSTANTQPTSNSHPGKQRATSEQAAHILKLLHNGHREEAVMLLAHLLDKHPNYPLPKKLQDLAESQGLGNKSAQHNR